MEIIEIERHGALKLDVSPSSAREPFQLHVNGETVDLEKVSVTINMSLEDLEHLKWDIKKMLSNGD